MGTHPIFESDFDCLTDCVMDSFLVIVTTEKQIQELKENYFLARGQSEVSNAPNRVPYFTSKFQYAHGLVHSEKKRDILDGIRLLTELLKEHSDDVQAQRDYAYYIAIGYYRKREFEKCITKCTQILKLEKDNHQAKDLLAAAEKKLQRDGLIGMGVAAGAVSLLGGVAVAGIAALAARNKMK